jgi:hypothetical protein
VRKNRTKTGALALIIALCGLIIGELIYLSTERSLNIEGLAMSIVSDCDGASYRPTCYEEKVPRLMDDISMEDAFKVTYVVQELDPTYKYCHVLGHKLSANETAKDPDMWQEVVQRCPPGVCSNGCIHGAFQERFRTETLTKEQIESYSPQFMSVCEKREGFNPTKLEQATCYHALGHLLMYVTSADIDQSLYFCDQYVGKPKSASLGQICYDGAFMQIYQPLEPDDFALIEGKEIDKSEMKPFCDRFSGKARGSCWSEGWPLYKEEITKPNGVEKFCSYLPATERARCFESVVYVMISQLAFDTEKIENFCGTMNVSGRSPCFANAASRFIETDYRNAAAAVAICEISKKYEGEKNCYEELLKYSTYNFHPQSEAFRAYCSAMPEPWKSKCLNRG